MLAILPHRVTRQTITSESGSIGRANTADLVKYPSLGTIYSVKLHAPRILVAFSEI